MPAHRYWSLMLGGNYYGGIYVLAVSEIEMRATASGANLCTGGTAYADSSDFGYTPDALFDGNPATIWSRSGGSYVRVWYDFGSPVSVAEFMLRMPGASAARPGSTHGPIWARLDGADAVGAWRGYAIGQFDTPADDLQVTVAVPSNRPASVVGAGWTLSPGWPAGPVSARLLGPGHHADLLFGGQGRIADTVAIAGTPDVPVGRRVRLYDQATGQLMRETWSDPITGAYAFDSLRSGPCVAMALDHTLVHEPAVLDGLLPAP